MLAAFHDTCLSHDKDGHIDSGTERSNTMLSWHKWRKFVSECDSNNNHFTVEHVAPQRPSSSWDEKLKEDTDLLHCLGNLTILPADTNSSANNKSWVEKESTMLLSAKKVDQKKRIC